MRCLEYEALVVLGRFVYLTGVNTLSMTSQVTVLRSLNF